MRRTGRWPSPSVINAPKRGEVTHKDEVVVSRMKGWMSGVVFTMRSVVANQHQEWLFGDGFQSDDARYSALFEANASLV